MIRSLAAACVSAAFVAAPIPAAAATARYASPTGSGTACTSASPCSIVEAIGGAAPGDNVLVIADQGDFNLSAGINTPVGVPIHIKGQNGRARLIFSNGGLRLQDGTAANLYVENDVDGATAFALDTSTASADGMIVKAAGAGHACYMDGATLTNSVCWAGSGGDLALETDGSNTLRNDTFIGGSEAAVKGFARSDCSCSTATNTLINVIARAGPGGADLEANSDGTRTMDFHVTYSNFATTLKAGTAGLDNFVTDSTDQSAAPVFADAASGDFHEAAGSPTIDAGVNSPANGSTDFDGNLRTIDGKTDIGADEFVPAGPPFVYWASRVAIGRANLDGTGVKKTFITGVTPWGVAVDGGHIYWTDPGGHEIGRANTNGTGVQRRFIPVKGVPQAITVQNGLIYWADGASGTIGRADVEGGGVKGRFIVVGHPQGVAVDGKYIYWGEHGDRIGRAKLNGTGVKVDFVNTRAPAPLWVAVTECHIFWSSGTAIGRAKIGGGGVQPKFIPGLTDVHGVAVAATSEVVPFC